MSMVKRTLEELVNYEVPGHFNCDVRRVHGKDETGAAEFWVGRSTILPGGGAEYGYEDNPFEKMYYLVLNSAFCHETAVSKLRLR